MSVADWFAWPEAWPVLGVVPLAWVLGRWRSGRRAAQLARDVGPRLDELIDGKVPRRQRAERSLWLAGIGAVAVAVLQPTFGETERAVEERAADLVVCVDVSRSMLARDVLPNRLARAQHEIGLLAQRARGDRLGLVAFAGSATLVVPRTTDVESFVEMVGTVSPVSVERGGTDLGAALEVAADALARGGDGAGTIVLLTDGDDPDGRGLEVAAALRARGIVVHCIGFGSPLGSKIAIDDGSGEAFVRDRAGVDVVSALDATGLERITAATDGEFIAATSRPRPLVDLYERRIAPLVRHAVGGVAARERANRYRLPLAFGIVLLLGAWLLRRVPNAHRSAAALLAGVLAGCGPGAGERAFVDGSFPEALDAWTAQERALGAKAPPELLYDQALAALRAGRPRQAEAAAEKCAVRGGVAFVPERDFLVGNAAFARSERAEAAAGLQDAEPGAWQLAIDEARAAQRAWQSALFARPGWNEARRNLERVLARIADLERKKAEAEQKRKRDPKPREPEPPPDEPPAGDETEPVGPDPDLQTGELTADQVSRLFDRLAAKERAKLATRTQQQRDRGRGTERDW